MTNEIKEILDGLKLLCYDDYCLEFSVDYIERKQEKLLLDYITNLQQRIDKALEYIDEHTIHDTPKKLKNGIYEQGQLIRTCSFYIEDLLDILRGDE